MFIKNTTDVNNNKIRPKIVGIHKDLSLAPGEEQYVPDELIYVEERNRKGEKTGRKYILPALVAQQRMGLISMREGTTEEIAEAEADEVYAPAAPAVPIGENKEDSDEEAAKKAEAAAKRAATRAANKAAKEAAAE